MRGDLVPSIAKHYLNSMYLCSWVDHKYMVRFLRIILTDTFLSSSCLLWGLAAALTSASDAWFGCPMARPIRPTLWTAFKKQHAVHMSVNTVKILQPPLQEISKLATEFFSTWEKHLFKLSIVVKPTTRSSATPQSYTDRKQSLLGRDCIPHGQKVVITSSILI